MAKVTHIGGGKIPEKDDNNSVSWQKCSRCEWLKQIPTQDTGVRLMCEITGNDFTLKECVQGGEAE